MSLLSLELPEYVLGQRVSKLFSTVVDEMDGHSRAVHTPMGRAGFGQHSWHATPPPHSRMHIETRGKGILRRWIYPQSYIRKNTHCSCDWYEVTENTVANWELPGYQCVWQVVQGRQHQAGDRIRQLLTFWTLRRLFCAMTKISQRKCSF